MANLQQLIKEVSLATDAAVEKIASDMAERLSNILTTDEKVDRLVDILVDSIAKKLGD